MRFTVAPAVRITRLHTLGLLVLTLALWGFGSAQAQAAHLQGGFVSANVEGDTLSGTISHLDVYGCSLGQGNGVSLTITAPNGATASQGVTTNATRCITGSATYTGTYSVLLSDLFGLDATDGTYVVRYYTGNRIGGIVNFANSFYAYVGFSAQVNKTGVLPSGSPYLGSNIATGVGQGSDYSQNLNASDPDADPVNPAPLTYQTLTKPADPDAADYDVISLSPTGQVTIPAATTATYSAGQFYTYKVRVTDDQGDYAERDVLLKVGTNNSPPVISGLDTSTPYEVNSGESLTIPFEATDPEAGDTVSISGAGLPSWAVLTPTPGNPAQGTLTLNPPGSLTTGTYGMNFDAVDDNSSVPLTGSANIQVRILGVPDTTIDTSSPAQDTTATAATFTFSSNDPDADFECSLDSAADAAYQVCVDPVTYSGLADGEHVFRVRGVDVDGRSDTTPATYTWTIDTVAPEAEVSSGPDESSGSATASFGLDADEPDVTYACSLDGAAFTACSDPQTYSGLIDGDHTFRVRATDAAGNTGPASGTYEWTVDTVAPAAPNADTVPADPSNVNALAFSGEADADFECSFDSGLTWDPCTSPLDVSQLADGPQTVLVRQTDPAGNVSPSTTFAWTRETGIPDAPEFDGSPDPRDTTPAFAFTGEDGATYECRIDGGNWVACSSPFELTETLADGEHAFDVRQTDQAGNRSAAATYTWTVDQTADDAPVVTLAPAPIAANSRFEFTGNQGSAIECRLDGGDWMPCSSPFDPAGLADGPHTLSLRQTDGVGNVSGVTTRSWILDTVAPGPVSVLAGPTGQTTTGDVKFEFAGEPDTTIECRIDGGAWIICAGSKDYAGLGLGEHAFEVRQTDAAGNVSVVRTERFTLVEQAPAADDGPRTLVAVLSGNVTLDGDAATVGCKLAGVDIARCTVKMYATINGERVLIGTGTRTTDADTGRIAVQVRLNRAGRRYVNRVGGVLARFEVTATPVDGGPKLHTTTTARVHPARSLVIPASGLFASGSSALSTKGQRFLDNLVGRIAAVKAVRCVGHTDSEGSAGYNMQLGEDRATTVCSYLRRNGMKAKVTVSSSGETRPRSSNATARGRALNRRVELKLRYR